ncbi:MAG: Stringent starvation protein B [Pseudolabrys sp.]|nr:Stringent starvation protein B [Pseudolabrys sp.]
MASDQIRYDLLTQQALRGMVRDLLAEVARKGLPGDHHFFISFDTLAEGVKLSQRMRAQYPQEMTIVLQHQFWDLAVSDDRFEVGLSFNGIPERLTIPFDAVKGFFDPSVQFGLQFEQVDDDAAPATAKPQTGPQTGAQTGTPAAAKPRRERTLAAVEDAPARKGEPSATVATIPTPSPTGSDGADKPAPKKPAAADKTDPDKPDPDKPAGGGEVVRLDRFRKK